MKRYRYAALALALGAIAFTPAIAQAVTPVDLDFQTYRGKKVNTPRKTSPVLLFNKLDSGAHDLRYKLIYSE